MSRLLGWSCCALCLLAYCAWSGTAAWAQEKRIVARVAERPHEPVYDYVPVGYSNPSGIGYCGPLNCGANGATCASCDCGNTDGAADNVGAAADCGCGGCDGSCGCGPGNCYCGSGAGNCGCGTGDCGCGTGGCGECGCGDAGCGADIGSGCGCGNLGCGTYDMGCGTCDYGCAPCNDCCAPECDVVYECVPERCGPKFRMWGDYLYLQVTDADVTHAQQQDGTGGAGTVPFGEIGSIGEDFHSGYRVGGSIACGPCTSVGVSYTFFESDSQSGLDAPDVPGGGGAVGSLVHHPGAALTASAGPVDAAYNVDFQLGDVMWRRVAKFSPRYAMAFSAGLEYGHLEQTFSQSGIFGGGLGGAVDTNTRINFDGAGIKVGVDGDHTFGHGCGIYGRLAASGLTGRFNSNYSMFNESTDQFLAQAAWEDDRVIGHIEYEIGASLTSMNNHWRASAGYMFSYWTNVVTTADFIDAVQSDNYNNVGNTIGFNGLVGRVECMW